VPAWTQPFQYLSADASNEGNIERVERRTFDGRILVLGTTLSGTFFVEAALFADIFHCDTVATEPSQVCIYPKAAVLNALRADPARAVSPFITSNWIKTVYCSLMPTSGAQTYRSTFRRIGSSPLLALCQKPRTPINLNATEARSNYLFSLGTFMPVMNHLVP
jgi:hypothetical protein